MLRRACVVLVLLGLVGCDEPPPPPGDAGSDTGPTPTCDRVFDPYTHGGDGAADPLPVPAGEVRAGRITAADLPPWPTGLETWSPGDFVLASETFAVVIEDVGPSDLYDRTGGRPVGLTLVEDGTLVRPADYEEVLLGLSGYLVYTDRVSVIADGSDGGAAIIRASGPMGPIDFIGALLDPLRGSDDFEGWQAAIDYVLEPGASGIDVVLHVDHAGARNRRAGNMLLAFMQGYRMPVLVPGVGFRSLTGALPYVAFDDEWGGAGWAWQAPEGETITSLLDEGGVTITTLGPVPLAACSRVDVPLGRIVIGDGIAGVLATLERDAGTALTTLSGHVTESDGTTPAPDVRVHVSVGGEYFARVRPAADGSYSLEVPAGALEISAYRIGFPLATITMPAASAFGDIELSSFGTLHVMVDEGGTPSPARIQVFPASGVTERPPEALGERPVTSGRDRVEFTTTGESTMRLPLGEYRVVVSRGYEYELEDSMASISTSATTEVAAHLRHSVDTTGVMCADYHIHTSRSLDSEDDARLKVSALVADGLEIPIRSDHEFIAEMQPVIESLGLEDYAVGLTGEELSTWEWGHFGVFPLVYDRAAPSGGRTPWEGRLAPAVFAEVLARPESPLLVVNHPRAGSIGFGYFTVAGYDPVTGVADREDLWDETWSILEVVNGESFEAARDGAVRDWFSFLSQGREVWAVGSSDSHHIYGDPVGYPRTCLTLGTDDPHAVTPAMVADATGSGHAYVSGGLYLDVEGPGGEGPGDRITGAGATASFHVVVRAAEWISADALEVIVDGVTTETFPLDGPTGADPTVRFDDTVVVPVDAAAAGSWVVFHASASDDMADLHPGRRPFAFSNPVYLTR